MRDSIIETHRYYGGDWAVNRWDWFNDNPRVKPVHVPSGMAGAYVNTEPHSFCQFWRTVLLWITLARLPFIGGWWLTHLQPPKPRVYRPDDRIDIDRVMDSIERQVIAVSKFIWLLLWPVRKIAAGIGQATASVVSWIDEAESVRKGTVIVLLVIGLALILYWLVMVIYYLSLAWREDWKLFMVVGYSTIFGLLISIALLVTVGEKLVDGAIWFIYHAWRTFKQAFLLIWHAIIVSKHKVCPPIEIIRE